MSRLVNWLKNWNRQTASGRRPQRAQLGFERLETRLVPASLGTKTAVLDFDGEFITAAEMLAGGWGNQGSTGVNSFTGLFNNTRPSLDMNGNGVVDNTDATLAINQIVAKVRADYAPYDLQILVDDFDNQSGRLFDLSLGDAFVMISGGNDVITGQGAFGVAPSVDLGNLTDNIVFAFGGAIAGASSSAQDLINRVARTVSHEMGHSFGLAHITTAVGDAVSHHLMSAPVNGTDPRDFNRDFVFQDSTFSTTSGNQNSHQILSNPFVLGPSANSWMAVLRPGQLTISGTDLANAITVTANATNTTWTITGVGAATTITLATQNVNSMNPFDQNLSQIIVNAKGGNDTVSMSANLTGRATIDGGSGNDSITGGAGADILRGGDGNDSIVGGGGNDQLLGQAGDDVLRGGTGNDTALGGDGADSLFGDAGNDRLDGGDELFPLIPDVLTGGSGNDVFVQHQGLVPFIFNEDVLADVVLGDTVQNV